VPVKQESVLYLHIKLCCLEASFLQQPVLSLDSSDLRQPMLPLNVPVLQRPMLLLNECLFYRSLCCTWTCLVYSSLCALGRFCSTAVCLSLDEGTCMWVFYSNLYSRRYLAPTPAYSSFRGTWNVPLQEPVLHLHSRLQELCAAPERVCLQKPALHLCVSVYKSFVLHLDMSTRVYAAPVRVRLAEIVLHLDVSAYKSLCCNYACLLTRAQPTLYL
jgi:hypothetical protein